MTYMSDPEHIPRLLTLDTELQSIDEIGIHMPILSLIPVCGVF